MTSDAEIRALIERLRQYEGRNWENTLCYNGVRDEAAAALSAMLEERDSVLQQLRTVQNAAKTLAAAQGTELEHLRQNKAYDHSLRSQHESLMERDAQMTDALLTAEARITDLEQKLAKAQKETAERCAAIADKFGDESISDHEAGGAYWVRNAIRAAFLEGKEG